ncbi:glycosyltransferase family 1 protein [Lentzea tibetensis]|uniref:Glycosyltransferase family 1 protein n=1 Tax=Lentzea tibetensis TaxID=2591470 RepID=A0A563ERV2_9PSEU|nr:glycosyltransferase [Lentzea tibetensis]TWP49591.1 glycosyltransferase family 1 protein [Lentzea tibetensis]
MARILLTSLPFAGHVGAMTAVTGELARRGHDLVVHTGEKYHQRFDATWLPWTRATDFDDSDLAATFPRVDGGTGFRSAKANVEDVLVGTGAGQAADIITAARREPFDLIIADHLAFGGALAAEVLGTPWATIAVTPLSFTSRDLPPAAIPVSPGTTRVGKLRDAALRGATRALLPRLADPMFNAMRAAAGLGPGSVGGGLESLYSPHLVVAQGVPGLEYERSDLPAHVHFVGRLAPPTRAGRLPAWWPDLVAARNADRPIVHVTQGTLDVSADDLLKPAIAALAGHEALVVCTTGGAPTTVLGPLPDNVRAAPFVPHDQLLPMVDVMVTNGGWGGVLAAVQAAVPLVVAAGTLDKPEVARRVARSGVGVNLRTGKPTARAVRRAVEQVLSEPHRQRRAHELSRAMVEAGGVGRATNLLLDIM